MSKTASTVMMSAMRVSARVDVDCASIPWILSQRARLSLQPSGKKSGPLRGKRLHEQQEFHDAPRINLSGI
jgi:hypothetical protein